MHAVMVPTDSLDVGDTLSKFLAMAIGLGVFLAIFVGILLLASIFSGKIGERVQALAFVGPALLLIGVALLYPAVLTIRRAFYSGYFAEVGFGKTKAARGRYVGFDNFKQLFSDSGLQNTIINTALWVILVPLFATGLGLLYAVLVDRTKGEALAKALIFLPMAISMVGATLIWKFVYSYNGEPGGAQVGLLNAIITKMGGDPVRFLTDSTAHKNTLALIVIMVWIQAGFAMTVLSAAIKAIPDDIIEAAKLDGVGGVQLFRHITLPSIRSSMIVVLTTVAIATLKAFDIVQASSGGKFGDSVLANEFYVRSFVTRQPGLGAAIAVVIFLLVLPIIIFNVIQMRKDA